MAILSTDLKMYKSATVGSTSANGGIMSTDEVVSGIVNNLWPNTLKSQRDAGQTLYRKVFLKANSDNEDTLVAPQIWNDLPTSADDYITFFAGTQTDTQADITGSERIYGVGTLNTAVSAGGQTIIVDIEDSTIHGIFQVGDTIRITDMATPDSSSGNEQFMTIATKSTSTTEVTLTTDETLDADYASGIYTRIMSVYEPSDTVANFDSWVETSTSGTYDESVEGNVIMNNTGTVEETVTITFTDATNFTAVGSVSGTMGSGVITSDFAPINSDFTVEYFTIDSDGWGGTWAAGETIVFDTHPAALPIWMKRVTPAGTSQFSNNKNTSVISGESTT